MGRVALVRMEKPIDAVALFSGDVNLQLQLSDGTIGKPAIVPGSFFLKELQGVNAMQLANCIPDEDSITFSQLGR